MHSKYAYIVNRHFKWCPTESYLDMPNKLEGKENQMLSYHVGDSLSIFLYIIHS